jgi:hypothetical protein
MGRRRAWDIAPPLAGSIAAMRRTLPLLIGPLAMTVLVSCAGTSPSTATTTAPTSTAADPTPSIAPSVTDAPVMAPSATPVLPEGVPSSYPGDVPAGDVPLRALIPKGATVDGSWYATTSEGETILVAYAFPTGDPFRAERGLVLWARTRGATPWRATFGLAHPVDEGVLSTQALIADLTGDASPDALVMEATGGSGTCGAWRVLDLSVGVERWNRTLCDAQVVPSTSPVGIEITEAVFERGDAHCCPSATRTTVLTYAGEGRWTVASKVLTPTGG